MFTEQCSPYHEHKPLSSVKIWAHHIVPELKVRGTISSGTLERLLDSSKPRQETNYQSWLYVIKGTSFAAWSGGLGHLQLGHARRRDGRTSPPKTPD